VEQEEEVVDMSVKGTRKGQARVKGPDQDQDKKVKEVKEEDKEEVQVPEGKKEVKDLAEEERIDAAVAFRDYLRGVHLVKAALGTLENIMKGHGIRELVNVAGLRAYIRTGEKKTVMVPELIADGRVSEEVVLRSIASLSAKKLLENGADPDVIRAFTNKKSWVSGATVEEKGEDGRWRGLLKDKGKGGSGEGGVEEGED
jgi:hypothetical protein